MSARRVEFVVPLRAAAAGLGAALLAGSGSIGLRPLWLVSGAAVAALALLADLAPRKLGLGPESRAVVVLTRTKVAFVLRDIVLPDLTFQLILPFELRRLRAREFGIGLLFRRGIAEISAVGLELSAVAQEPREWQAERELAALEAAARAAQLDNPLAALVAARRAEAAAANVGGAGEDSSAEDGQPSRTNQWIDAALSRVALRVNDGLVVRFEARGRDGVGLQELTMSMTTLELTRASAASASTASAEEEAQQHEQPSLRKSVAVGNALSQRWRRDLRTTHFKLAVRELRGRSSDNDDDADELRVIGPIAVSNLRLTCPPVMCGLLAGTVGPRRLLDVDITCQGPSVPLHLETKTLGFVMGFLRRYQSASAWKVALLEKAEARRRRKPPSVARRLELVELMRRRTQPAKSKAEKASAAEAGASLAKAEAELCCEDIFALRLWAAEGEAALRLSPAAASGDGDSDWRSGTIALLQEAEEAFLARSRERPLYHELRVRIAVDGNELRFNNGAVLLSSRGVGVSVDLLPTGTDVGVCIGGSMLLSARSPDGSETVPLLRCGEHPADSVTTVSSAGASTSGSASGAVDRRFGFHVSMPSDGPMHIDLDGTAWRFLVSLGPLLNVLIPTMTGIYDPDAAPAAPDLTLPAAPVDSGTSGDANADTEPQDGDQENQGTSEEKEALPAEALETSPGYLGGMVLEVHWVVNDFCLVFPTRTSRQSSKVGVEVSARFFDLDLRSNAEGESLKMEVKGAAALASSDHQVLEPMDNVRFGYSLCKDDFEGGYLKTLEVRTPMALLCLSPSAAQDLREALAELTRSDEAVANQSASAVAVAPGATSSPASQSSPATRKHSEAAAQAVAEAEKLATERAARAEAKKKILRVFERLDVDKSGSLDRKELLVLVSQLCADKITQNELALAFEDLWAMIDSTNDGLVSFEEFCHALDWMGAINETAYSASVRAQQSQGRTAGHIVLRCGSLNCKAIVDRIGGNKDRLWDQISGEPGFDPRSGVAAAILEVAAGASATASEVAVAVQPLQMKLLRSLVNYEAARSWWESEVAPRLFPAEPAARKWVIHVNDPFLPANKVMLRALAGHLEGSFSDPGQAVEKAASTPGIAGRGEHAGLRLDVEMQGFELCVRDALSQLQARDRIQLAAGSEEQPALVAAVTYWHDTSGPHLGETDSIDGSVRVRGLRISCLNPFCDQPEPILERWSFGAEVKKGTVADGSGKEPGGFARLRLVSDRHLVLNLSPSSLLSIKPTLQALGQLEEPVSPEKMSVALCDSPLDHLLRALGGLGQGIGRKEFLEHSLILSDSGGVGGPITLDENPITTLQVRQERTFSRHTACFTCRLPLSLVLTRVEVCSPGWEVEDLRLDAESAFLKINLREASQRGSSSSEPSVKVVTQRRLIPASLPASVVKAKTDDCEAVAVSPTRSGKGSWKPSGREYAKPGELWVMNSSGWTATAWFGRQALKPTRLADGCKVRMRAPFKDQLNLRFDGNREQGLEQPTLKPDLASFGRFALRDQENYPHVKLSISGQNEAVLELQPPVRIRNGTHLPLRVKLLRALGGQPEVEAELPPGGHLPVPVAALRGDSWYVVTEGALTHAFALAAALKPGEKGAATRRVLGLALRSRALPLATDTSAERGHSSRSLFSASSERSGFGRSSSFSPFGLRRRFKQLIAAPGSGEAGQPCLRTLLLLPGLRVSNALPLPLKLEITRAGQAEDASVGGGEASRGTGPGLDRQELQPGGVGNLGLVAGRMILQITCQGHGNASIIVPAGATFGRGFQAVSQEIQVGTLQCSVVCRWVAGVGPEMVICGDFVLINKTGLPLSARATGQGVPAEKMAILRAPKHELQVRLEQDGQKSDASHMPRYDGMLFLRMGSQHQGFTWVQQVAALAEGVLRLQQDTDDQLTWDLSQHSRVAIVGVQQAGGEENVLRLEDPCKAHALFLRSNCAEDLDRWLRQMRRTISALKARAEASALCGGFWDKAAHGNCQAAALPNEARGTWSSYIPVQVPGEGEVSIIPDLGHCSKMLFLGVQIRPMLGALSRSMHVTITPRFVVQNRTSQFLEALPALLPVGTPTPTPEHAALAACREALEGISGHKRSFGSSLLSFGKHCCREDKHEEHDKQAVWIPPGESVAFFHFPLLCESRHAREAHKAVTLRLAGKPVLEVITTSSGKPLRLERVGTSFAPYLDEFCHFGPLPPALRYLCHDGRLTCFRDKSSKRRLTLGNIGLTTSAFIFLGIRVDAKLPRPWVPKDSKWEALPDRLDLRLKGRSDGTLRLFRQKVEAGVTSVEALPEGSVLLFARRNSMAGSCGFMGRSSDLPWCDWVKLDVTGEERRSLQVEEGRSDGVETAFVQCSMQVEGSIGFLVISDGQAPYRAENRSPTRTLALRFEGCSALRVLPPLSWCAFDWPAVDVSRRKILVQDVASEARELYEVDVIGRGNPLSLQDGVGRDGRARRATGADAPLTEKGYREVMLRYDTSEMAVFVRRVATELGGSFSDEETLRQYAKLHSGEIASRTLRQLRQELVVNDIVPLPRAVISPEGCRAASICDAAMAEFILTLLRLAGLAPRDTSDLMIFASGQCDRPNLQQLLETVAGEDWVVALQPVEKAYAALSSTPAGSGRAAGAQLCLWRALEAAGCADTADPDAVTSIAAKAGDERSGKKMPPWNEVLQAALATANATEGDSPSPPGSPRGGGPEGSGGDEDFGEEGQEDPGTVGMSAITGTEGSFSVGKSFSRRRSMQETAHHWQSLAEMEQIARSQPMTEEGYMAVAALNCTVAMVVFVRRLIAGEGAQILDSDRLQAFCAWHSCERTAPGLAKLREELALQSWLFFGASGEGVLGVNRFYDGSTKVISFMECGADDLGSNSAVLDNYGPAATTLDKWDIDVQLAGLHLCLAHEPRAFALGTGMEASSEIAEETMAVTVDHVRLWSEAGTRRTEFRIHHWQVDNLRSADANHPVVLAPRDSGFHSDRRELPSSCRQLDRQAVSFLHVVWERVPSDILHIKELRVMLRPLIVRLDVGFVLELVSSVMAWFPNTSGDERHGEKVTQEYVRGVTEGCLEVPQESSSLRLIYLECLHIGALCSDVELLVPPKGSLSMGGKSGSEQADAGEEDGADVPDWGSSAQRLWMYQLLKAGKGPIKSLMTNVLLGLSGIMESVSRGVLSGVAHITPSFSFPETMLSNEFSDLDPLLARVVRGYVSTGLKQWWKVLFSTNILGDPIGWGASVTGGVVQFFRKTGSEIYTGNLKGEGVKSLAQGVVGGTFRHTGKLLGALGDTIDAVVAYKSSSDSTTDVLGPTRSVHHVGDGVMMGANVMLSNTKAGLMGILGAPSAGLMENGGVGLATGVVKGISGVVAKPVSGLLHGTQNIMDGIDATTHLWDKTSPIGPRRPPRLLCEKQVHLEEFAGPEFLPRICCSIIGLSWPETGASNFYSKNRPLSGSTWHVELRLQLEEGGSETTQQATGLGSLVPGGLRFEEELNVPSGPLLGAFSIYLVVVDRVLGRVLYRAQLASQPFDALADLLDQLAANRLTERPCLTEPLRIPLVPEAENIHAARGQRGGIRGGPRPELLVRLTPGFAEETIPLSFTWTFPPTELPPRQGAPPSIRGTLEKHGSGTFDYWAQKFVLVENGKFMYWDNRRQFDDAKPPKLIIKLRPRSDEDLRRMPFRFVPGDEPESTFRQVHASDGRLEARWRPCPGEKALSASEWLQAILQHSMRSG